MKDPQLYFFTASPLKLIALSVCSLGVYDLYWFYKNWHCIRARTGRDIKPFWRAFFSPFWAYPAFKNVDEAGIEYGLGDRLHPAVLAVAYVLLIIPGMSSGIEWMVSLLSFVPILPANRLAMQINRNVVPSYKENDEFSRKNWAVIVIGGIVLVLAILGTFLEPVE